MADEPDFQPRPGRIRSSRSQRAKPFVAQALAAAQRAGGGVSRASRLTSHRQSRFGRGRVASVRANRLLTDRSRLVTIKTRVMRHAARSAPLSAHLGYLRREGVTRDGEKARLFDRRLTVTFSPGQKEKTSYPNYSSPLRRCSLM